MFQKSLNMPKAVSILESTLREGLENEELIVQTEAKLFIVERLLDAGVRSMEVGGIVLPDIQPQFRDTKEILKKIPRKPGYLYLCNFGPDQLDMAIKARQEGHGPDILNTQIPTSEKFCQVVFHTTVAERWKFIERTVKAAHDANIKLQVTNTSVWYCPFGGEMPMEVALEATGRMLEMGCDVARAADPFGVVTPTQAYEYFSRLLDKYPDPDLHAYHQHDYRGFGLANYVAAMQAGCTHFDTTLGGTGGICVASSDKFIPWATFAGGVPVRGQDEYFEQPPYRAGLVSTEDFVVLCDAMGIETGIDVQKVLKLGKWMERILERKLWSSCLLHGRISKKHGFLKSD